MILKVKTSSLPGEIGNLELLLNIMVCSSLLVPSNNLNCSILHFCIVFKYNLKIDGHSMGNSGKGSQLVNLTSLMMQVPKDIQNIKRI